MLCDLLPDETDKFNGIADLLADRDRVGAHVALLPQSESGDAAGVLQPLLFGRLLVAGRGHGFAHRNLLVEVMGLGRSGGDVELLDLPGADMDDLVDVLEGAVDQQELGIGDE